MKIVSAIHVHCTSIFKIFAEVHNYQPSDICKLWCQLDHRDTSTEANRLSLSWRIVFIQNFLV